MSASSKEGEELPQSLLDRNESGDAADLVEKDEQMQRMELKIEELQKSLELAKEKLESFGYTGNLEEEAIVGPSVLLQYLPKIRDVSHIILEHLVTGEGGAQAILNLRKVNSATKEWVDNQPTKQSDWIFKWIPIKFSLNLGDLKKFDECPPPAPATAIIMYIGDEWKPFLHTHQFESMITRYKSKYPGFFTFWSDRMKMLHCSKKSENIRYLEYFDTCCHYLDSPKALKHFDCFRTSRLHAFLFQVETLIIHEPRFFDAYSDKDNDLSFYQRLASSLNLKRLRIRVSNKYERDQLQVPRPGPIPGWLNPNRNLLEGLQLLVDKRRNDPNFEAVLEFDWFNLKWRVTDPQIRSFIESVAASASKIRITIWDLSLIEKTRTLFLGSTQLPVFQTGLEFLKCLQGVSFKDGDHVVVGNLLERKWLPNLKQTYIEYHKEEDIHGLSNLPSSLTDLKVSDRLVFPVAMRNWPKSLTGLEIELWESPAWTPLDFVASMASISQNCPHLNRLVINDVGISEETLVNWKPSEENASRHSFKNLKSLSVEFRFMDDLDEVEIEQSTIDTVATKNLLLEILQVQHMSLLKLTLGCYLEDVMMVIDSECVTTMLNSHLGKSLVTTNVDKLIDADATESLKQFQSAVQQNRRIHEKKFGRQGRRLEVFDFTNLAVWQSGRPLDLLDLLDQMDEDLDF